MIVDSAFREQSKTFNDAFPWSLADYATDATSLTHTGPRSFAGTVTIVLADPTQPHVKAPVGVDLDETFLS